LLSEIEDARSNQDDLRELRPRELHNDEEQAHDDGEIRDQEILPDLPQAFSA
jgi:hypothetical protein